MAQFPYQSKSSYNVENVQSRSRCEIIELNHTFIIENFSFLQQKNGERITSPIFFASAKNEIK